jgi:hypothetical protein
MYSDGYLEIKNAFALRSEEPVRRAKLSLHGRSAPALVLFRVLLGGVWLGKIGDDPILQNRNVFCLGDVKTSGFTLLNDLAKAFPDLGNQDRNGNFLAFSIISPLENFFVSSQANRSFFEVLLNELCRSFLSSSRENHLSAFVYIYRAIEHMSFALPFFHARHSTNYIKAFSDFKAFVTTGDGELRFCDKFVKNLFSNDIRFTYVYKLQYELSDREKFIRYFSNHHQELCSCTPTSVNIEFGKAFSFIVDIRNKFFHHLSGSSQSISAKQINDADAFFKPINDVARSIIAAILAKLIASELT